MTTIEGIRVQGVNTVIHASSPAYSTALPEVVSPLLQKILESSSYTHLVSAHSSSAKSIVPRVAAKLDVPAVSDVTSVSHDAASNSTTFTRPIYAGNAVATVKASSDIPIKVFTVRSTAFAAATEDGDATAEVKSVDAVEVADVPTEHLGSTMSKSDRPELGSASKVVSGGRALKNAETFKTTLEPLADVLGAAVGASRAAVDAGYADNSLQVRALRQTACFGPIRVYDYHYADNAPIADDVQVGQTGKVVAPELYIAVGISGAIQHLAGMKDSKLIVAINKVRRSASAACLRTLLRRRIREANFRVCAV